MMSGRFSFQEQFRERRRYVKKVKYVKPRVLGSAADASLLARIKKWVLSLEEALRMKCLNASYLTLNDGTPRMLKIRKAVTP
jgi:hypothetical protein